MRSSNQLTCFCHSKMVGRGDSYSGRHRDWEDLGLSETGGLFVCPILFQFRNLRRPVGWFKDSPPSFIKTDLDNVGPLKM